MKDSANPPAEEPNPRRRLQWVLGGRIIVATILLGGTLFFAVDAIRDGQFTPTSLLLLISVIYASSVLFGVWLLRGRQERAIATVIIALDVLLITVLVYLTGGAASVFSFLYGAEILTAALTLGPMAAYFTAAGGIGCYVMQAVGLSTGWMPPPPDQAMGQYLLRSADLLPNVVGIALVAVLATNLAHRVRITGGKLLAAEQSAARLARLNDDIVRSIASGLITTDEEGRIIGINRAAREILRDWGNTLLSRPLSEVLPSHVSGPPGMPPRRAESIGLRSDGTEFPIGYNLSALVDAEGNSSGVLLAFQDLTEVKELRDRAEQAQRLAVLGRLATGLAHEIRNPLSSISGSVEMVREGNALGPEDRHLLGIVVSEVERLNQLVTTMLQAGRPSQLEPQMADLRTLIQDVVAVARADATTSNALSIEEHCPEEPVIARVDPDRMRQVIWNLVKNALQASPHGGTVKVTTGWSGTGDAYLDVVDRGSGISDSQKLRLFDVFYSGRSYGVGLGLALVKQIVDQHDATIEVLDLPEGGTCFRVVLPSADTLASPSQEASTDARQGPRTA